MADNKTLPATGTGTANIAVATDEIGGVDYQRVKATWGPDGTANDADVASGKPLPVQLRGSAGGDVVKLEDDAFTNLDPGVPVFAIQKATPANNGGSDGDYEPLQMAAGKLWVQNVGFFATVTVSATRAANTTTYAVNDNVGSTDSGGYTLTGAARVSGGSGIITDMWVVFQDDAAAPLQGEIHIFDTAFTQVADNAAYVVSDAEALTQLAIIPFALADNGNQGVSHVQNLSIGFTTVGSANLRFAIVAKNAYVPTANSSVISIRLKILQIN